MIGWEGGLIIVVALPIAVLVAVLIWPQRTPKDKSVTAMYLALRAIRLES